MYLTYEEYKKSGGEMTDTAFCRYEYEAEKKLERITKKRIHNVDESTRGIIKECLARVLELEYLASPLEKRVTQWRHDGVQKSFSLPGADDYTKKINAIIGDFLAELTDLEGVPLLYRGVGTGNLYIERD